jgi:hypothetical protein
MSLKSAGVKPDAGSVAREETVGAGSICPASPCSIE